MGIYRIVCQSFWNDPKISDDFTPEDRYFMLYCLTNPYTNLAGCYEISIRQMSIDLGYNKETIEKIVDRFIKIHKNIDYDYNTKELIVKNWNKYNWTESSKLDKPLRESIERIKSLKFKKYLADKFNERDTVSIRYRYGINTVSIPYLTKLDTLSIHLYLYLYLILYLILILKLYT